MLFKSVVAALACSPFLVKAQNETSPSVGDSMPANLTSWSWTSGTDKMHGVALGNWLVLERWMNWQWFRETSGSTTAEDEWSYMEAIGDEARAVEILTEHWERWITDEDVALMAQSGFNHIRIPIGYWAWIPQHDDVPYAFQAGQVEQMTRVIAAAQANGLYVLIDLHGLPGSQNGEQPSGHVGLNGFYGDENQRLGDQTVDAVIAYIEASPYRSAISGFEVCNEPVYYTDDQFQTLLGFYERTYEKIAAMADPVPMMIHPGSPNSNPLGSMIPFINGKDPNLLVFTIHPYIGRGASLQGLDATEGSLLDSLCSTTSSYQDYPIPIAITEWSLINPIVNNTEWEREWYAVQTAEYAKSGGGIFWSYRINITEAYDGEELITFYQYSFLDLLERGSIPLPANNETSSMEYLNSLNSTCTGTSTVSSWPSPISGTAQSTSTGRAQRKRLLLHEAL